MAETKTKKYYQGVGRRKRSIASVRIFPGGKGEVIVNDKKFDEAIPEKSRQEVILSPIVKAGLTLDVSVKVLGGGKTGQAEAIRHGIARAIVDMDADLKKTLKVEGFLKRDPRKKERKKPGLKKARRAKQWRKR